MLEQAPRERYGSLRLWGSIGFIATALAASTVLSVGLTWFPAVLAGSLTPGHHRLPAARTAGGARLPVTQ